MDNNTTEVVLSINGEQAKAKLKELEESAKQLKAQLDKTADPKAAKKLEKNIESVNKRMQTIESHTKTVERTLRNLDKASPKQLNETLGILRTNLNNIERGSKAWDKQVAAIRRVQLEIEKVNGELRASQKMSGGGFAAMGKSMLTMFLNPTTLAMGAVAGLTRVIRGGIDTITDFEQANANLAAVLGTTRAGILDLTADAKRLGATTMFTASEVTQLQTELAKLGFSKNEILSSTDAVLKLSAATGAGLGEAAALAGASMRAFNLDATEMERVTSVLAVSTTKSALSFEKLATALPIVSPVAKQFGFTIEDTVTLLGKLSDAGFEASSAATATRNIFLNLANDSGKLAKALGRPIKSIEDLGPALVELRDKGVNLAEMLELTDKRSVAAFATFVSGADDLKALKDSITDCSEALDDMVSEQMNTLHGSTLILKSAWEGLMLSFSNSSGPLKTATDALAKLIQKWTEARTIAQGGEGAVTLFRKGGNKDIANQYIQGFSNTGMSNGEIQGQAQRDIKAIQDERAELSALYEQWGKVQSESKSTVIKSAAKAPLAAINPALPLLLGVSQEAASGNFATRKEVKNKLTALGVDADMEAIAKRLAELDDQIATKQMVVDMLAEKTEDEDGKGKKTKTLSADDYRAKEQAKQNIAYAQGITANEEYKREMLAIDVEYYRRKMEEEKKGTTEYLKAYSDYTQAQAKLKEYDTKQQEKLDKEALKKKVEEENITYETILINLEQFHADGKLSDEAYKRALEEAELNHLDRIRRLYEDGSKEQLKAENDYQKASLRIMRERQKEAEAIQNQLKKKHFADYANNDPQEYQKILTNLDSVYQEILQREGLTNRERLNIEREYQMAKAELALEYNQKITDGSVSSAIMGAQKMKKAFESKEFKEAWSGITMVMDQVKNLASGMSELIQAECDAQVASIEARYDKEIKAAGKNEQLVSKLEEKKENEINAVRAESSRKQFGINVATSIADAAMSIVEAWRSASGLPFPANVIVGSLVSAMITGVTAAQIATMKKQQATASGFYAKGRKGGPAEYAIVGEEGPELMYLPQGASIIPNNKIQSPSEWENFGVPVAKRINTIGSLSPADVSGSITANQRLASFGVREQMSGSVAAQAATSAATTKVLEKLNKTISKPIFAVTTISGDKGIRRAQRNYDHLMKNKSL